MLAQGTNWELIIMDMVLIASNQCCSNHSENLRGASIRPAAIMIKRPWSKGCYIFLGPVKNFYTNDTSILTFKTYCRNKLKVWFRDNLII